GPPRPRRDRLLRRDRIASSATLTAVEMGRCWGLSPGGWSAAVHQAHDVALRVGEEADDQPVHDLLGPEHARAAELLHLGERRLDVGHGDIERGVPAVALGRLADAAADAAA